MNMTKLELRIWLPIAVLTVLVLAFTTATGAEPDEEPPDDVWLFGKGNYTETIDMEAAGLTIEDVILRNTENDKILLCRLLMHNGKRIGSHCEFMARTRPARKFIADRIAESQ